MKHCRYLVKLFLLLLAVYGVLPSPTRKNEIQDIFKETKRDVPSTGASSASAILKSSLFNPYLYPPPIFPGKPFFYPLLTPPEILLNRFAKATTSEGKATSSTLQPTSNPLLSSYFKAKKNEFLAKLLENMNSGSDSSEITARNITPSLEDPDGPTKAVTDPYMFLNKKLDFLEKLFKSLNATTTTSTPVEGQDMATTTKPTIVPPNFWFPFLKPPKPPKAPKPTKPPKAKKVLKDTLDAMILQSILTDLGIDSSNMTFNKRAVMPTKKVKSKKVKAEEDSSEVHIPVKIDPTLYSTKASDCLDKLFKILSKADSEDLSNFIEPKATVIPNSLWTKPSETEYTSKLDAFLDLLIKSLNATDNEPEPTPKSTKMKKVKTSSKVIRKRSTFLDELLHRIPPSPTPAVTIPSTMEPNPDLSNCQCGKIICCCTKNCWSTEDNTNTKVTRSLIFKPFGTGYWIPQYLYAAKMSLYLDKLMDTINTAAAEDVSSDGSSLKRSVTSDGKLNITGMDAKEAAVTLLITELTDIKNDLVEAFGDGIKAQKSASTAKPFNPAAKSFKKPFWAGKTTPTADPIEPIQKRIDILNELFDKITEVEKVILFTGNQDQSKLINNTSDTLDSNSKSESFKLGSPSESYIKSKLSMKNTPDSPDYYLEKTREFLQNLYASKSNEMDNLDD